MLLYTWYDGIHYHPLKFTAYYRSIILQVTILQTSGATRIHRAIPNP